jgi:protein-disulfide isomerase
MNTSRILASIAVAALLSCGAGAADRINPSMRDDVDTLRDEVRALQQELRDMKQALAARRGGWEKIDAVVGPEDSPQLGAPEARLVLIEFSDYQCPYCARHYSETFKQLERDYIATGRLRYVVAEMPIGQIHPLASKAAEAARCAREQGKFWEMHARLFSNPRQLEPWAAHAEALGLDVGGFQACLDSARHADGIQRNAAAAQQSGISSTPTFLLGVATSDTVRVIRRLRGAAPYAAFKSEIDALLAEPVALK